MSNSILLNDSKVKRFVIVVSILIPAVVTLLYFIPQPENLSEETKQQLYILPRLNAIFNGTAFFALIGALIAIKTKRIQLHKALTTTAMVLSVLFLVSYVIFHLTTPSTPFGGEGTIKVIYLIILLSHILLRETVKCGNCSIGFIYLHFWFEHASGTSPQVGENHLPTLALCDFNWTSSLYDD